MITCMPASVTRYIQNVNGQIPDLPLAMLAMQDQMAAQGVAPDEIQWSATPILMGESEDIGNGFVSIDVTPTPGPPDAWRLQAIELTHEATGGITHWKEGFV